MNNILKLELSLGDLFFFVFNLFGESVVLFVIGGTGSELELVSGTDQSKPPLASKERPKIFEITTFAASAGLSFSVPDELGTGFGVGLFEA